MRQTGLLKWVTVGVLSLGAVFFFLPYRFGVSAFEGVLGIIGVSEATEVYSLYGSRTIDAHIIVLFVALFILPLILTLLAALLISRKFSIGKCIASAIFCAIALLVYYIYFDVSFLTGSIGLVGNMAVAGVGFVLVILNIIAYRARREYVNADPMAAPRFRP